MSDLSLKPCPWCGDENPAVSASEICCPVEWSAEVHCTNCDASGGSGGVYADKAEAEIEAIDIWNCRPTMHDAAQELYGALEETTDELATLIEMYNKLIGDPINQVDAQTCHENMLTLAKARGEESKPSTLQSEKQGN